jgi:hypothetical protein
LSSTFGLIRIAFTVAAGVPAGTSLPLTLIAGNPSSQTITGSYNYIDVDNGTGTGFTPLYSTNGLVLTSGAINISAVPEPSTWALCVMALLGLCGYIWRNGSRGKTIQMAG